jgi:hypothetical protein
MAPYLGLKKIQSLGFVKKMFPSSKIENGG